MNSGWHTLPLDDVCNVEYGTRVVKKRDGGTEFPVYGGGGETFAMDTFNREDRVVIGRFGMSPLCTRFVSGKFFLNDSGLTLSPKNGNLLQRYVDYWAFANNDTIYRLGKGSAQKNLDVDDFRQLPVSFPPLPEQRRIVGILDEAFAAIATAKANTEKNLQNARAVFESHRQAILTRCGPGWHEKPFADLCDIKHGFAFKSEFFTDDGEYVLLTPGNFFESGGYRDRGDKQKYYQGEIPKGFILGEGELLVAMTEQATGLLGSPILVPDSNKFLHNQRLGLVQAKPGVSWVNEYFFHVFNLRHVRDAIHESGTGVKVRHTSPTKIGEVVVAFPSSVAEQLTIVQRLAALTAETQRLESLAQQKLAALDALKKSLLHQAFTGQLTGAGASRVLAGGTA